MHQGTNERFLIPPPSLRADIPGELIHLYNRRNRHDRDGDASGIFNSEVPGERAPHDAISTLRMGVDVNKQLTEVRKVLLVACDTQISQSLTDLQPQPHAQIAKTATMALGMKMEDMDIGDPAWWGQVLLSGMKGK